jgi:hypothetical protein
MDTIAQHLQQLSRSVRVPRSVPGLVSRRVMVMSFMDGLPLLQLKDKVAHLPQWKREKVRAQAHTGLANSKPIMGGCVQVSQAEASASGHTPLMQHHQQVMCLPGAQLWALQCQQAEQGASQVRHSEHGWRRDCSLTVSLCQASQYLTLQYHHLSTNATHTSLTKFQSLLSCTVYAGCAQNPCTCQ